MSTLLFFGLLACLFPYSSFALKFHVQNVLTSNLTERLTIDGDITYYIAAIEIDWSYCPNGTNVLDGKPVDESEKAMTYTKTGVDRIGQTYRKAVYREFTDVTFTTQINRTEDWVHLGIMGPVIRATVDQRIKIVFQNQASFPFSMHPHGVAYDKTSEGAVYDDFTVGLGDAIAPNETWVYFWDVREESGGSDLETSSKFWLYHSHVNEPTDTNAGLVGPMLITKEEYLTSSTNFVPTDIDREFVTLFTVFDENVSPYLSYNIENFIPSFSENTTEDSLMEDDDFIESNLMHSMNGYQFGYLGKYLVDIKLDERVRWYLTAMGTEVDIHTAHWHGNLIKFQSRYYDVFSLFPAVTWTVDMIPDKAGTWFYHCHVNDHVNAGMIATYTVSNETLMSTSTSTTSVSSDASESIVNEYEEGFTWDEILRTVLITLIINCCLFISVLMMYGVYRKYFTGEKFNRKRVNSGDLWVNEREVNMNYSEMQSTRLL